MRIDSELNRGIVGELVPDEQLHENFIEANISFCMKVTDLKNNTETIINRLTNQRM